MDKSANKDERAYLFLLRDSFSKIRDFTSGMSLNDFSLDGKTQSAVIMQLHVIGELAKKMPQSIKDAIDIPWKQMAGLRDWISHDYFSLDLPTVWQTVQASIPQAEQKVADYLNLRTIK